jgi:5'-3' exonuclease
MQHVYPLYTPIVLWDGRSKFRKEIYPDYKGNRKPKTKDEELALEEFYIDKELLGVILTHLGITQLSCKTHEADDLAYLLSRKHKDAAIGLVTEDKDWTQIMRNQYDSIYFHRKKKKVSYNQLEEFWKLKSRKQFLQQKALMGDASDNVKGIGGIGSEHSKRILKEYGSVERFIRLAPQETNLPKALIKFSTKPEKYELFQRNMDLVDLSRCPVPDSVNIIRIYGKQDLHKLEYLANELDIPKWFTDFENWVQPFTRVKNK